MREGSNSPPLTTTRPDGDSSAVVAVAAWPGPAKCRKKNERNEQPRWQQQQQPMDDQGIARSPNFQSNVIDLCDGKDHK